MKSVKQFLKLFLFLFFLTSCTTINKDNPNTNTEDNINENANLEKERIEIKFSCRNDEITKYLEDGWIILKEDTQEKVCSWKSVPATKNCDMEKDKGCKLIKPDKIGEEKIYLLEK